MRIRMSSRPQKVEALLAYGGGLSISPYKLLKMTFHDDYEELSPPP